MKHSALLKTTAAMGAALTMTCAMATGAFADQVYSISDATISVGRPGRSATPATWIGC